MCDEYKDKFEKLVKEEQEEARKKEEFHRKLLELAEKVRSQIKEVCKEFVRVHGKGCRYESDKRWNRKLKREWTHGSVEYFTIKGNELSDDITISVEGNFSYYPICINVSCSHHSVGIPPEEFTNTRLADAVIKVYKKRYMELLGQ